MAPKRSSQKPHENLLLVGSRLPKPSPSKLARLPKLRGASQEPLGRPSGASREPFGSLSGASRGLLGSFSGASREPYGSPLAAARQEPFGSLSGASPIFEIKFGQERLPFWKSNLGASPDVRRRPMEASREPYLLL